MTPFAATSLAPPADPIRAALDDPALWNRLSKHALCRLNRWLADKPRTRRVQESQEIVAETMKRAWQNRAVFNPAAGVVAGWVHGILVRVTNEHCRKLRKLPTQPPADFDARTATIVEPPIGDLTRYLERLSPEDRALIQWFHLDEDSHADIANRLGISEGTVRTRLCRAMARLKKLANGEGQR